MPWVSSERRAPSSVCCLSYSHHRFGLGIKPQSPDSHSKGKSYSSVIKPGVTTNNWNTKPINSQLFWPDTQTFWMTPARQGPFSARPRLHRRSSVTAAQSSTRSDVSRGSLCRTDYDEILGFAWLDFFCKLLSEPGFYPAASNAEFNSKDGYGILKYRLQILPFL